MYPRGSRLVLALPLAFSLARVRHMWSRSGPASPSMIPVALAERSSKYWRSESSRAPAAWSFAQPTFCDASKGARFKCATVLGDGLVAFAASISATRIRSFRNSGSIGNLLGLRRFIYPIQQVSYLLERPSHPQRSHQRGQPTPASSLCGPRDRLPCCTRHGSCCAPGAPEPVRREMAEAQAIKGVVERGI